MYRALTFTLMIAGSTLAILAGAAVPDGAWAQPQADWKAGGQFVEPRQPDRCREGCPDGTPQAGGAPPEETRPPCAAGQCLAADGRCYPETGGGTDGCGPSADAPDVGVIMKPDVPLGALVNPCGRGMRLGGDGQCYPILH